MKKEKVILTDCDGCLVNWNKAFDVFMTERGHPMLPNSETVYNLSDRHGITQEQANEYLTEFNESDRIASLEMFADSKEIVTKLHDKGFKFVVVTSLSKHPSAHTYRTSNLAQIFGDVFDEIICIEINTSKYSTLRRWAGSGYFWIEDHMRQAEAGYEVGLKPILISHPYNSHYSTDLFPRVSHATPWTEIYKLIEQEYDL